LRLPLLVAVLIAVLAAPASALAAEPPPGTAISDSLGYLKTLPGTVGVVDGTFDRVRRRDVLVATGRWGIRTYDVSDPRDPKLLDTIMPSGILGPNGLWENEDVDLDRRRKLVIVSIDPRHDSVDQAACPGIGTLSAKTRNPACRSGLVLISYRNPRALVQVSPFVDIPAGHTSTCIAECRYVWTGGPARRSDQDFLGPWTPGGVGDGRPIWVTDLRNPTRPRVLAEPIDLYRNHGVTDYSHDVQVDADGIAWTSGRGGILGYATEGRHFDPRMGSVRRATPARPVLVAGGGVQGTASPLQFMHNSLRPLNGKVSADGVAPGGVLIGTEEQFSDRCDNDGRLVFSDLTSSLGGERAAASTAEAPFDMPALASWHPTSDAPDTLDATTNCSAHYFDLSGGLLATTWYGEGTRLLDVSDARAPRQVGYYRVTGTTAENPSTTAFSVKWREDVLYVFDIARGIELVDVRIPGGEEDPAEADGDDLDGLRTVRAPAVRQDRWASRAVSSGALVCPILVPPAA
jgi:hypothetical protein